MLLTLAMHMIYLDHINHYIQHKKALSWYLESSDQSFPHSLLFPNEYNWIAPLVSQMEMDSEDNNISTDDSDKD